MNRLEEMQVYMAKIRERKQEYKYIYMNDHLCTHHSRERYTNKTNVCTYEWWRLFLYEEEQIAWELHPDKYTLLWSSEYEKNFL